MGLVILLKAGMVGGFGFLITIGLMMALLISASRSMNEISAKVSKLPSFMTFLIVLIIEAGLAYWYFFSVTGVTNPSELNKFTIYACLFSLAPSVAIIAGALSYYYDVQKVLRNMGNK